MNRFLAYLARCGIEFDTAFSVLTGGPLGQTLSYRCAVARQSGKRWGCIMCWLLNWLVQRDHCADQLSGAPMPWFDMLRAAGAFIFLYVCIGACIYALVQLL